MILGDPFILHYAILQEVYVIKVNPDGLELMLDNN